MEKVDESEDRKRGWRGGKKAAWCQVLREGHCDESASSNDAHICYVILPALPGQEFTTTPPPAPPGTRAGASPDLVPVFFCVLMALASPGATVPLSNLRLGLCSRPGLPQNGGSCSL